MAEVLLPNYSDDSKSKEYIMNELMPRVFHDVPMNNLNVGMFSLISEYMSQGMEQQAFTSSFFFNESFITKAVLPDSIYSEAAIFNIGYSFATPSAAVFVLELKLQDIYANAKLNADTKFYEFILDKNTKINLSNGSTYSLDYDILLRYKNEETASRISSSIPTWDVHYINTDEQNSIAVNKNIYINYRVTGTWLCLYITASEYEREVHTVVNNLTNGLPNDDTVISCINHICGFDIKYIDGDGNEQWIPQDHILPINATPPDKTTPYVHYIMDNQQTIRFEWQLYGNRYFVPPTNTSYEITVYTCHGEAANFTLFDNTEQPSVISSSNRYSNNGNVMKNAWLASGSMGGTNIGNVETVRRETIEAYNTAKVLSTDHDIDEWMKTFFFKNVLYPFFFKRRDDPWGRIWSGYLALKDNDDHVFRTNTLQANIPYDILYANNDNTVTDNEIVIPPGWIWVYDESDSSNLGAGMYTVVPYTKSGSKTIETADTNASIEEKYVFASPFGMRIQKQPFAMAYFNQWINETTTTTRIPSDEVVTEEQDLSYVYHATPIMTNIKRTYAKNYYNITTFIDSSIDGWVDGSSMVRYMQQNAPKLMFSNNMWNYFKQPLDLYTTNIPIIPLDSEDGYISFDPSKTYFCTTTKEKTNNGWLLSDIYILDNTSITPKKVRLPVTGGNIVGFFGDDDIWGDAGMGKYWEPIYASGDTVITIFDNGNEQQQQYTDEVLFNRVPTQNYYELKLSDDANTGLISKITVDVAVETDLTKFDENTLWRLGTQYQDVIINVFFQGQENPVVYTIVNAANVYTPYAFTKVAEGLYETTAIGNVGSKGIILYAEMKPVPESGAIEYYRLPFSRLPKYSPMFDIRNAALPVDKNNMRVVLHSILNGSETGRIEMQPLMMDTDGTYRFEARMYPLNEMVDIDNRINIASIDHGGGSWIPAVPGSVVNIDATKPELKMSILVRSQDSTRECELGEEYTGFRIVDEYMVDPVALVQELKEMRSTVKFSDTSLPTDEQMALYRAMMSLPKYDPDKHGMYEIGQYAYDVINDMPNAYTIHDINDFAQNAFVELNEYISIYQNIVSDTIPDDLYNELVMLDILRKAYTTSIDIVYTVLTEEPKDWNDNWRDYYIHIGEGMEDDNFIHIQSTSAPDFESDTFYRHSDITWESVYHTILTHVDIVNNAFSGINVHNGLKIQLVPFIERSLMTSDRFESFVSAFTQVHKAIEPVIMKRLEGNHYLDCKLIATYGRPHSYVADIDADDTYVRFWPDLRVQLEFDVYLQNPALSSNTISELRTIIKSYFGRLTTVHTPVEAISMNINIYISNVIQLMKEHPNVEWLRFNGWYTDEKNKVPSDYKDANVQGIVRRRKSLDDMTPEEMESYVPELFVLDDEDIVINILK